MANPDKIESKVSLDSEPQQEEKKPSYPRQKPLVATRDCNVVFDDCVVELAEGQEAHGLRKAERDYLIFHGFVC